MQQKSLLLQLQKTVLVLAWQAVVLVGAAAYKYIARPLAAKIKAKKEAKETAEVESDCNKVTEDVE